MAWGEKRENGKWRAGWRDEDDVRRYGRAVHKTKALAVAEGTAEEKKVKAGRASKNRKITWGEWRVKWLATRQVAGSTDKVTRTVISKWLMPHWDSKRLDSITPHNVREWLVWMKKKGASPYTIQKALSQLSASLTAACEVPYIDANPCAGIKGPKPPKGPGMAFTRAEADQLLELLAGPYRMAATLMLFMGLRFGEMAGMHWADVFEARKKVYVSHTWSRDGRVMEFQPKDEDCRWVPIPNRVLALLERPDNWREKCGYDHQPGDPCPGQLVVPGPAGAPLDSHNVGTRHWKPALRALGLEKGRQHDLRHTYITWLIEAGMTAEEVGPLVGHSSTYITARYTHLLSKHHGRALDILNQLGLE